MSGEERHGDIEDQGAAPVKGRKFGGGVAFADSRSRVWAALTTALFLSIFVIIFIFTGGSEEDDVGAARVQGAPRTLDKTTGGDESPEYTRLASDVEKTRAEHAKERGDSFVPSLVGAQRTNELTAVDPLDEDLRGDGSSLRDSDAVIMGLDDVVVEEPPPLPIEEPLIVDEPDEPEPTYSETDVDRLRREMRDEFAEQAALAYQAAIARENARRAALYNGFTPEESEAQILGFAQQIMAQKALTGMGFVEWGDDSEGAGLTSGGAGSDASSTLRPDSAPAGVIDASIAGSEPQQGGYLVAQVADVDYAVMLSAADSDAPGFVRAQVVSGRRNGAVLLGSFAVAGDYLQINFTTMVWGGQSYTVDAYAVDPLQGQRAAVRSDVDRHIASRLSGAFLQTFADTYAEVVRESGTRVVVLPDGSQVEETDSFTSEEILAISAGDAVGESTGVIREIFDRETTVTLDAGSEIGVLYVGSTYSDDLPRSLSAGIGTTEVQVYP